ncbi:MAG: hypothetical protein DMF55_09155, partial [Acidobacteria bacterium]
PSRILHGPYASREAIEREAAWVPLVLGLATVVVAGLLAARLYGALAGALVALFVAIAPGHLLWSQYGHVDQNVAESFAGVAALLAFVASREKPDSGGNVRREVAAGIVLTLAVLTWQGAIYWGAIFALALFIESLRTGRSVFRPAVATLALPAALAAGATLAWTRGLPAPFTYVSFGLFQPVFLAGLAAGLGLLDTAVARARGSIPGREFLLRAAVLAVLLAAVVPFGADLVKSFAGGVGYVAGRTVEASGRGGYVSYPSGWLKGIFETRPLFADGIGLPLRQLSLALFVTPVAIVLWTLRVVARRRPGVHAALAVWGCVTLFLAVSQRLNVYYAVPLCAIASIEAARLASAYIRRRARPPARPPRRRVAVLVVVALAVPMAAGIVEQLRAEPDASPPRRPVRRAAVRPASSSARARASHRGPRSVVARTPRAVRIGGPGGRQQFRVRLPRLDPVLPRVVGSRGPRDRAEPARPVGPRGGPGAAPERLRGVPGPPAAPRSDRQRARPSPRLFRDDAGPAVRLRRKGRRSRGTRGPAAHGVPPRFRLEDRNDPGRPLRGPVEGLRDHRTLSR